MKLNDFIIKEIDESVFAIPIGKQTLDFRGVIKLNQTAHYIWQQLQSGQTMDAVLHNLTSEFEVDENVAKADLQLFMQQLSSAKIEL